MAGRRTPSRAMMASRQTGRPAVLRRAPGRIRLGRHRPAWRGAEASGAGPACSAGVAPLQSAGPDDVSFLDNRRYAELLAATKAGAVIVHPDFAGRLPPEPRGGDAGALCRLGPGRGAVPPAGAAAAGRASRRHRRCRGAGRRQRRNRAGRRRRRRRRHRRRLHGRAAGRHRRRRGAWARAAGSARRRRCRTPSSAPGDVSIRGRGSARTASASPSPKPVSCRCRSLAGSSSATASRSAPTRPSTAARRRTR